MVRIRIVLVSLITERLTLFDSFRRVMNELQAVVLAGGKGNRLELVDDCQFDIWEDSERALLPVAGIPVFWYPLNVLAKNGITSKQSIRHLPLPSRRPFDHQQPKLGQDQGISAEWLATGIARSEH